MTDAFSRRYNSPVSTANLSSGVVVMKSAKDGAWEGLALGTIGLGLPHDGRHLETHSSSCLTWHAAALTCRNRAPAEGVS